VRALLLFSQSLLVVLLARLRPKLFSFLSGIFLLIAGGMIGAEAVLRLQPNLKNTLYHLHPYSESLGFFNLIIGCFHLMQVIATTASHDYSPLAWLIKLSVALCALSVGWLLSANRLAPSLKRMSQKVGEWGESSWMQMSEQNDLISWSSMIFGVWMMLEPWIAMK
jgi:hypothetical protein